MALIGSIVIGLSAQSDKLVAGLNKGARSVKTFSDSILSTRNVLLGFASAFVFDRAVSGIKSAIDAGSSLNETISKTGVVLGDAAPAVEAFADEMANKFGIVRKETLDVASAIGGLGSGLGGLSGKGLSDFTTKFTKLAADLQSMADLGSMSEAGEALLVGLSGEQSDTLKKLGVTLLDTKVKAEAAALGYKKLNGEFSDQAKVAARASLIAKGLAKADGDLERTAGSAANQMRFLSGTVENLKADLAMAFQPATEAALRFINEGLRMISAEFAVNQEAIKAWAQQASTDGGMVAVVIAKVAGAVGVVGDVVHTLGVAFKFAEAANLKLWADVVGGVANGILAVDKFFEKLTGLKSPGDDALKGFADSLRADADKAAADFRIALSADPPSAKIEAFFARIQAAASAAGKGVNATLKPAMAGVGKQVANVADDIEKLAKKFKVEAASFGMGARTKEIEELREKGATADQLLPLQKQAAKLDLMDRAAGMADELSHGPKLAGASQYGSSEAASIVTNYQAGAGQNPLERLNKQQVDLLRQLVLAQQKKQQANTAATFALASF